jgi:hypothetical protein
MSPAGGTHAKSEVKTQYCDHASSCIVMKQTKIYTSWQAVHIVDGMHLLAKQPQLRIGDAECAGQLAAACCFDSSPIGSREWCDDAAQCARSLTGHNAVAVWHADLLQLICC